MDHFWIVDLVGKWITFQSLLTPQSYQALIKGLLEEDTDKRLTIEEALRWPIFLKETSPQILAYLREFVQILQWEQRVKENNNRQQHLTSAQQLPLPHFTGYVHRPIETKVLEKLLAGTSIPIACTGIGGVGKTQLLTYIIHTPEVQVKFRPIFWFRAADNETSLNIQYYGFVNYHPNPSTGCHLNQAISKSLN